MVNWRGYICHKCMCSGVAQISGQLEEGVESVYHGYIFILLYMTLMWCSGVAQVYGHLEQEG